PYSHPIHQIAYCPAPILPAERTPRGKAQTDHPRDPPLGMRLQVRRVHRTDESGADQTEIDHGGNSPTATSSRRSWSAELKWMPWMPSADAAAALAATSSMKTADSGATRSRSHRIRKMRGSGLITPSRPETTLPSNHDRNGKRTNCGGKVSADQLVIEESRPPRWLTYASTSTAPAI